MGCLRHVACRTKRLAFGIPSSTNGSTASTTLHQCTGHSRLTGRQQCPSCTAWARACKRASRPGGGVLPPAPPSAGTVGSARATAARAGRVTFRSARAGRGG